MSKTIDIFYKSYKKDFKLLHYSLESLKKNVTGYNNIIILIPESERNLFNTGNLPERTIVYYVPEYGNGYLYQQWCKISGHRFSQADFILFADSDCIWHRPINLQDFIKTGKPQILYTDYSKADGAIIWKQPTETFMHMPVQYEFMRRNCLIYHRSTLVKIAEYEPNLEYIIMNSDRFSEFNAIGAYAYFYDHDNYEFTNTNGWVYEDVKAIQLWSYFHSGNSPEHAKEKQRAIETINQVLNLNITDI